MKKFFVVLISLFSASQVFAQSLSDAVSQCRTESNSLKRLVCYDKLAKSLDQYTDMDISTIRSQSQVYANTQSAPQATVHNQQARVTSKNPTADFGIEHKQKREEVRLEKLVAQIAQVKKDPYDKLIITLANGQVWKQVEAMRINLKKGNRVYIERGMFDSFFIGKEGGNKKTRVKRVK